MVKRFKDAWTSDFSVHVSLIFLNASTHFKLAGRSRGTRQHYPASTRSTHNTSATTPKMLTPGQRGAALMLSSGPCPARSGRKDARKVKCTDQNCKVQIDQSDEVNPDLCYVGATQSFGGYGPWLCCNHAKIQGWGLYELEACQHCRVRKSAVNRFTGMSKTVKGVPDYDVRPTSGWSHGNGKARKRLLLHNKRLTDQGEVCHCR